MELKFYSIQTDAEVFFIGLIVFLSLVYFVFITTESKALANYFFSGLVLKLMSGIGVGLLYFYHYRGGDTVQYDMAVRLVLGSAITVREWFLFLLHSDLSFLASQHSQVLMEPRSLFFVKILSILYLLSGKSYWMASIYLSLFSFWGSWYLVKTIMRQWPQLKYPALASFLYFPPLVFWSSGVLKDSVAYACIMALSAWAIMGFKKRSISWREYLTGIFLIWILWSVKYHLAAILILSLVAGIVYQTMINRYKGILKYGWFILFMVILIIAFSFFHPNFRLDIIIEVLRDNQERIILVSEGRNIIHYLPYGNVLIHFLLNLPLSLFAGLFMPLPWQGSGFLPDLTGVFNALILVLTILKILSMKQDPIKWNVWYLMTGIYVVLLAVLMAYATPNFGTLERYKTAYMPFFICWLLDNKRLLNITKSLFIYKFW